MLASDYASFGPEALRMQQAGVDYLHMDVMDGCFVPNISFGAGVISALCAVSSDMESSGAVCRHAAKESASAAAHTMQTSFLILFIFKILSGKIFAWSANYVNRSCIAYHKKEKYARETAYLLAKPKNFSYNRDRKRKRAPRRKVNGHNYEAL